MVSFKTQAAWSSRVPNCIQWEAGLALSVNDWMPAGIYLANLCKSTVIKI